VEALRPVSLYELVAEMPTLVPPLYILYPASVPELSVLAVQARLICEEETAVGVRPVGTEGGVVLALTVTVALAAGEVPPVPVQVME
jgi:hypothetical protein